MKAVLAAAAALLALALAPSHASAAISTGLGTFTSSTTGRWLFFDLNSDSIKFGSTAGNDPPASVFNVTAAPDARGLYRVQLAENDYHVSASAAGQGIATALPPSVQPAQFETFNLTAEDDGSFYIKAWNGAWADTQFARADNNSNLVFNVRPVFADTAAVRFQWNPSPYAQATDATGSRNAIRYRTLSTGSDANATSYNVSTFYPQITGPTGQMYAYTVKWIGDVNQPGRPMLMYLGGSDSRSNAVTWETDVLDKTQSTGFPKVVSFNTTLANALLKNYLLVVPASPTCYNTTTNSFTDNACGTEAGNHFLKHYRPWELKRIYDEVLQRFSFDTTRFALVGTGMGGRGGLRFLIDYPTLPAAVSMVSGALETDSSTYIKALPYIRWNSGEGCWDVTQANSDGACGSSNVVQPTMAQGKALVGFPIRLWTSRNDDVDTMAEAVETCNVVNSGMGGNCSVIDTQAPTHQSMAYYSRDVSDLDWLLSYQRQAGQASKFVGSSAASGAAGVSSGGSTPAGAAAPLATAGFLRSFVGAAVLAQLLVLALFL